MRSVLQTAFKIRKVKKEEQIAPLLYFRQG